MLNDSGESGKPLVSVILTTSDRPRFLSVALACYGHQTYPWRELTVVDDGQIHPADEQAVEAVGGFLLRVEPGTPLGTKLNLGVKRAKGLLCQKMDDDDWYSSGFLEGMVSALIESRRAVCRPTIAFLMPFLFFQVSRWEVRRLTAIAGATLLFAREDWEQRPFRAIGHGEDVWFVADQTRAGLKPLPVQALESFLAVRHHGHVEREHTWTHQFDGRVLEDHLEDRALYHRRPEDLLPNWAVSVYREIQGQFLPH